MHALYEKARKISDQIEIFAAHRKKQDWQDSDTVRIENEWGVSYLMANILSRSNFQKYTIIDYDSLTLIHKEYQQGSGKEIDLDGLFKKYWLRNIGGKIHVSGGIRFVLHDIPKMIGLKNELNFLLKIHSQTKEDKWDKKAFDERVQSYQDETKLTFDLPKAVGHNLIIIKDDTIKLQNLLYYKAIFENLEELCFIKFLKEKQPTEFKLGLEKKILQDIIENHRLVFPLTPSLNEFEEKKLIKSHDGTCLLNLFHSELPISESIVNKIGAILWELLKTNPPLSEDTERLRYWYNLIGSDSSWCNIQKFFSPEAKKQFLDSATSILLHEQDIESSKQEYQKLVIDDRHRTFNPSDILNMKETEDYDLTGKDLFELFENFSELENETQSNLLHFQESRNELVYYVYQIVENDLENKFEHIYQLLNDSLNKPFILWQVMSASINRRPGIIPFFTLNKITAPLFIRLLWKTEIIFIDGVEKESLRNNLIKNTFQLLCEYLSHNNEITNEEKARILFQCFNFTIKEQFYFTRAANPLIAKAKQQFAVELTNSLKSNFESVKLPGRHFYGENEINKLFYPFLLQELFELLKNYETKSFRDTNQIWLPLEQIDFAIWLVKLTETASRDLIDYSSLHFQILDLVLQIYSEKMKCSDIVAWKYESKQMESQIPSWISKRENEELIDWSCLFVNLEKDNLFDSFLATSVFKINQVSNKYDELNRFTGEKLRTHLFILIKAYVKLVKDQRELTIKGYPAQKTITKVEDKITSLIIKYCLDKTEQDRINIFDSVFERNFWDSEKDELLPLVGNTLNNFRPENRISIIKELLQTDQLIRSLKLLDYLVSENYKRKLIEEISAQNIQDYFSSISSFNEATYVLQELAKYKEFKEKASIALELWEDRKVHGGTFYEDEHALLCYRLKLLLVFHEGEEEKIVQVPEPILKSAGFQGKYNAANEKDFYRALIFLQKNRPDKAYDLFINLISEEKEDRPTLALNRFASKIHWAEITEELHEKEKLYHAALQEWEKFESGISKETDLEYIKEKIWFNKLSCYDGLNDKQNFEKLFQDLERPLQLRPDFLEMQVKYFMKHKMNHQAERVLSEAVEYHRLSNGNVPEVINKIRDLADTPETVNLLQYQYNRIFSSSPEQLIKIIPDNVNPYTSLSEFILKELTGAVDDLLRYINSIAEISMEDKYSDLIILSLASRFRNFQWSVGSTRGGYSASGNLNPGERDFTIHASNNETIAIIEALQLSGTNNFEVEKHNFKIFNYDHARKLFFILVYFKGEQEKYNETWEKYKCNLLDMIKFPAGYDMKDDNLEDTSAEFGNDSVKVGKGIHGENTVLYHVFVNINYRVNK